MLTELTEDLAQWMEAGLKFADGFPEANLSLSQAETSRAAAILDDVRKELSYNAGIAEYFDSSRPRYELTLALAFARPGGKVLDLGCSPGHLAMALAKGGFDVTGLDLNDAWLSKYAPGWADRLRICHANIEEEPIPFESNSFDIIIFTEVLEHIAIKDPQFILADIYRVLKPDGQLLLSTPNVANFCNISALLSGENIFWPPEIFYGSLDRHNREYTPVEVSNVLRQSGFCDFELGYMNTWSNWHHVTGPVFHHLCDDSERGTRLRSSPLFNNTIFARAIK